MTGPLRDIKLSPIRRRCIKCGQWKQIRGGTSGRNGKGFKCAECKEAK